jgi:hypothetical protein
MRLPMEDTRMALPRYLTKPASNLDVVSKPQIRFKGKAQADRESAAYMVVCEHLLEACNAAIGPQMGF